MKFSCRVTTLKENITEKVLTAGHQTPGIISLAGGTPPFEIPRPYLSRLFNLTEKNVKISQYSSDPRGIKSLRKQIARDLSEELGLDISYRNVLITTGSTAGLFAACQAFIDQDDKVLLFSPHWSVYRNQCHLAGGKVKEIVLNENDGWEIDFSALHKSLTNKVKLVVISDPVNPTGTTFSIDSKRKLLSLIEEEKQCILVVDETYRHLLAPGVEFQSLSKFSKSTDKVILCRSFSKDFSMSGFRLGFVYASIECIENLVRIHLAMNLMASTFSQELGRILYQSKKQIVSKFAKEYHKRRMLVCCRLDELSDFFSYVRPSGGFFVFPRFNFEMSSIELFQKTLKLGVLLRPGIEFGSAGENHVRISFTNSIKNINKAFDRLENLRKTA